MSSKINLITRLQHWMDSVPGQTFLNYAYSWGASIVILGALFKLTHLPGGNLMLFAGMGTEVFVFFISAFDRPFDKTEIGKELPHDYQTDEEIEETLAAQEADEASEADEVEASAATPTPAPKVAFTQAPGVSRPPYVAPVQQAAATEPVQAPASAAQTPAPAAQAALEIPRDADAEQLAAIIRAANDELLHRAQAVLSPEMEAATKTYIDKLQTLTDTFQKVDEQSARLTRDSEEMENLNRTLTGINKVYELHLKSISLQVGTIDDINNQTHKLAEQIQRLNSVYARMIDALTVNMVNQSAAAPREQSES
ncbi:gliding motility protein GldL [Alloprevotella tannerae]|uniref:type IX secretion system motor protein PorL/GldL n=1 Tax=Alloprevotella tannerae TaxID=76122 RepID=UPI001CB666A2|nr:gliding motility protein GldL [Alloprevotella tannerae]MBF0951536.1 gliding motility protein GldL [Alloprevotella tannerae]